MFVQSKNSQPISGLLIYYLTVYPVCHSQTRIYIATFIHLRPGQKETLSAAFLRILITPL